MSATQSSVVKLSFNVSQEQVDQVRAIAKKRGISMTEVLRHAIAVEAFLQRELDQDGTRIFIENKHSKNRKELLPLGDWR